MKALRFILLLLIVVGAALVVLSPRARLAGQCAWFAVRASPVDMVLRDGKDGDVVYLDGVVADRIATPFSKQAVFTLKDRTGSIHVVTEGRAPKEAAKAWVKGRVERDLGPFRALVSGGVLVEAETVLDAPIAD